MKIDLSSIKAFSTELPAECAVFIANLRKQNSIINFIANLDRLTEWYSALGKIEMGRWVEVLNDCDEVLELATQKTENSSMAIDQDENLDRAVISVLRFTSLLFENSFSRSVYSSMDHLLKLLDSCKMFIVVQTLRLLLVVSKSSRYITQHVQHSEKKLLYMKLTANTESWSGKLRSVKMIDCCVEELKGIDVSNISLRTSKGTVNFLVDVSKNFATSVSELKNVIESSNFKVEESEKIFAFTKLRLVYNFGNISARFNCVMARLISISVLFYSRCLLDEWKINCLVNDDSIEQICSLLQLNLPKYNLLLDAVKTEAMKTLASIVFLEKPRKIQLVVDCLGLNSYHGLTPSLIRRCVDKLKAGAIEPNAEYSVSFVTALFSLVYHIAGFDYGGESLISCSMIGSLLTVVKANSLPDSQISFITRAVRIIDILTGIDTTEFNSNDGMNSIVDRFVHEVNVCKQHKIAALVDNQLVVCHQQRTALMKSLLNFLKRAITDTNYAAQIRRIMEADLPKSIIYIIENPEYFGSSLLHCAIHLTTSFIYQEPAQLTFLQDNGLTDVLLKSLFDEKFPISRDIVTGLPNICSALCLNERGLKSFNEVNPLERIFRIIFSTKFILSLRKRKTEILEASTSLGTAFDELMRHQPTLRKDLILAFVKVLDDILAYGSLDCSKCAIAWSIGKMNSPDDESLRRLDSRTLCNPDVVSPEQTSTSSTLPLSTSDDSLCQSEKKLPINQQSVFQICHEQDGILLLPLGDYLGMIGALLEAILTNRAAHENSSMMLECNIPQRLVKLLTLERSYPALFQSTYLTNLANIIRHLLSQSNKIDAFDALASSISEQFQKYERCTSVASMTKERMFFLNRINCLAFVTCNFLKTSLSNVHDTRSLLLHYFGSVEMGQNLIRLFFETYRKLNCDVIFITMRQMAEAYNPDQLKACGATVARGGVIIINSSLAQLSASGTSTVAAGGDDSKTKSENLASLPKLPLKRLDQSSYERLIQSAATRLHKQLSEIVTHVGKIFCSTVSRPRRGHDGALFKHAFNVSELLFKGVVQTLEYDELLFKSGNSSSSYFCHTLNMLKKLVFDDYQGHFVMLPFFYKSGCHKAFFALGEFIVQNSLREYNGMGVTAWLSFIQRLVCVSNVLVTKNRQELLRYKVEGFNTKKYLALCHQDSLGILQKFFKVSVEIKNDTERNMLDKIIGSFQLLVKGIVQLYEMDKKETNNPEFEVLIHEIDTDKIQQLVEMGFSQSEAVDALLQHTSVPEAAEYLIAMDNNSRASATVFRAASTSENVSMITTAPAINVSANSAVVNSNVLDDTTQSHEVQEPTTSAPTTEPIEENEQMQTDPVTAPPDTIPFVNKTVIEKTEGLMQNFTFEDLKNTKIIGFKESIKYICETIVPDCILLIENEPNLVFCVSELLSVFMNDSTASDWFKNVFVKKMICDHESLVTVLASDDMIKFVELANNFSSILHLFCLLWEVLENVEMYSLINDFFITNITDILFTLVEKKKKLTFRLIPPILLCIDMYEKERRINVRQKLFNKNVEHVQWCYWVADRYSSNNEWRDYTPVCSTTLNKAFREGRSTVSLVVNDKSVIVDFIQMTQRQADSTNNTQNAHTTPIYAKAKLKDDFDIEELFESERRLNTPSDVERSKHMIQCLIILLQSAEETVLSVELAYSIISLLLRLVSMKGMSKSLNENDIKILVCLESNNRAPLMSTILTLILRACIDDEETLENVFASIIQATENGTPVCLADLNSRNWLTKSKKQQKEWRRVMCFLLPLAARNCVVFNKTMKRMVQLQNGEISLTSKSDINNQKFVISETSSNVLKCIMNTLVIELLTTEFTPQLARVLCCSSLLKVISEFVRNYSFAANYFVEMQHEHKTSIAWIIDRFMLNVDHLPEVFAAAQSLLVNLIVSPAGSRASEIIVNEIKSLLALGVTSLKIWDTAENFNFRKLCLQLSMLCKLIMLLRECAQANGTNKIRDIKQTYALIRYIHKKNLIIDFAKTLWHLPLNEKFVCDAVNSILRMFETVARDLIAVNSVRNANATAVTASATAAAAIAAATATAAQVQAAAAQESLASDPSSSLDSEQANRPLGLPAALTDVSNDLIPSTSVLNSLAEPLDIVQGSNVDAEMSELNVSQVLANIDGITRDNQSSSSNSSNDSDGTDLDGSDSEGSDGEGGDMNDEEDDNSDDDDDQGGNRNDVINGIRRRHRNLQRELVLDPQIRTSTPISEDELDQQADIEMRNERVIIGDEETDETQRDDDDDEMNEDDDEIMDEADDDDVIEFEDAITDYLDVTYVTERNNEIHALAQEFNRAHSQGLHMPTGFGNNFAFGGAAGQHDLGGRVGQAGLLNDFEILAASAGYVAGILTRFPNNGNNTGGPIAVGIPIGEGLERGRNTSQGFADNFQHPLLRRLPQVNQNDLSNILPPGLLTGNNVASSTSNPIMNAFPLVGDGHFEGNHPSAVFGDFNFNDPELQRMMLSRLSINRRLQHASGLRRQGALRRWHPIGGTGNVPTRAAHRFLTRLIDESLFPEMNVYRSHSDGSRELASERRIIESIVPYFFDRILDQVKLLDSCSMHYISLIVAAYLSIELKVPEEVQNVVPVDIPVAEKKENEEVPLTETSENPAAMEESPVIADETLTNPETVAQEGSTFATETLALQILTNEAGRESSYQSNADEDEQQSTAESIDSSELSNRLAVLVPASAESEENTRDSTAPRSPMDVDSSASVLTLTAYPDAESTSVPAELFQVEDPSTSDDFRVILGGIDVPDGVDPAFLAALPEDIRQEVIRDHLRQQRAQRINEAQTRQLVQPVVATDAANASETEPAANAEAVVSEDVLDQEFLAALPPELQEEVLAQHEQQIAQRNRQAAAAAPVGSSATNDPAADSQAAPVDIDAVFESLPPGLRAQVLADADDSVLQILPPNLLAEANRLRANLEQQHVFRFARMMDRHPRTTNNARTHHYHNHQHPSNSNTVMNVEEKGIQIFDKEGIITLLLLYFMDQDKFCLVRLQKLLKPLCLHSGTCDYIIWSLLSILNVLNNTGEDDADFSDNGWINTFHTQTALNQAEKAILFTKDGVKVHQLVRTNVCLRILDTLVFLARNFSQHFLPNKVRLSSNMAKRYDSVPDLTAFWEVVKNTNKKSNLIEFKPCVKALGQLRDIIPTSLEQSPLAFLLDFSNTDIIKNNNNLMDKSMKILQIIAQSVPSDSQLKISDESTQWLTFRLQSLANVILHACYDEGLKDGRMFFIEILRILPSQRSNIFAMLYETVKEQGKLLEVDINSLLVELEEFKNSGNVDLEKLKKQTENESQRQSTSTSDVLSIGSLKNLPTSIVVADNDLKLNTLKAFTKRNSQPKKFLKSLETISFLRNQLKQAEKRKRSAQNAEARVQQNEQQQSVPPTSTEITNTTETIVSATDTTPTINDEVLVTAVESTPSTSDVITTIKPPAQPVAIVNAVEEAKEEHNLEDMLEHLGPLWNSLSSCLEEMSQMLDSHAVLSLQHAAEAFFLAHALMFTQKEVVLDVQNSTNSTVAPQLQNSLTLSVPEPQLSTSSSSQNQLQQSRVDTNKYTQSMFLFAEKHRTVLNQILRGNTNNLMEDSAFAILTYFPKLLDFDVKRKYFYKEIRKLDDRMRHEDVAVRIRRSHLFSDSFRELFRLKSSDWKSRFYIIFEGEEGQDAGGLLREWYSIITREVFNPNYALFITAPGDRVTYMINKSSYINPEHLDYFKFVGRVIAKAIFDNKQLDCYFTRAFYKHILNVGIRYQDIESEDPSYFSSLEFLLNNPIEDLGAELTFTVEVEEFGVRSMRQLKEDGLKMIVTDANKEEYVQLVCQMKMTGSIRKQLDAFLEGFYQIIPKKLISIFNEQELELLISGLPEIDIDDLCNNTEYKCYNRSSPQIQWFWRALRSFEQEDLAKFLQFVTGTSKVPLQGFAHLEGMNGVQKFTIHVDSRSMDRLPSAHTCFNQLDLPKYDSYEQLRQMLLLAIRECSEGFAFA